MPISPFSLRMALWALFLSCLLATGVDAHAQQDQAEPTPARPAAPENREAPRPEQVLRATRAALAEMELSQEQRQRIGEAFRQFAEAAEQAARESEGDPEARVRAMAPHFQHLRETIDLTLTDTQRLQLRRRVELALTATAPADAAGGMDGSRQDGGQSMNAMDAPSRPAAAQASPPRPDAEDGGSFLQRLTAPPGLAVGEVLPESVTVVTLDGRERPLAHYLPRNRPLVVLLGSATSPTFRHRISNLVELQRRLGREAEILIIYTREQHAAGEWEIERNRSEEIELPQHETIEQRIRAARAFRVAMTIRPELVADSMGNEALLALVGEAPHCAALVFAPDGTLLARQQWLDPSGLPALVATAASR